MRRQASSHSQFSEQMPTISSKRSVKYAVIDAFSDVPFKGNPAAVCLLQIDDESSNNDEWMKCVAKEFNLSETAFLTPIDKGIHPSFNLRWFTPVIEIDLCGHGTIAAAHFLFSSVIANADAIEFVTKSGVLIAKKINKLKKPDDSQSCISAAHESFTIELDFPKVSFSKCDPPEIPSIPATLNGLSMINALKTTPNEELIVELSSGEDLVKIQPNFGEIEKCYGMGLILTAPAPLGSEFDFYTRYFCPKIGINEDPVTGSIHCALAPYWGKKLGKHNLIAYQASSRGGKLELQYEEGSNRVQIKGEACTIMMGTLLV